MKLQISPRAARDLQEIALYIVQDNPQRAMSFIGELRERCLRVAESPLAYRSRRELGTNLRSCTYGRYVLFFECTDQTVIIVRVLHASRDLHQQFKA
ncbi:type II toxin-antitoxin system RelE/ParE family toxin [Pseudomonas lundensis]|uniref:type II toxin-antitoxin system RelE/ParE family toxin n=1 Tax=Pseudomonas lundensis TaxID=86185 RepID=UPI001474B297|nr:type II toxin-antitoxin system RelE/ParE family toxin [Pseudomonas lundensis]